MHIAGAVAFYIGVTVYTAAGLASVSCLRSARNGRLVLAKGLLVGGGVCLIATFILRWVLWRALPLTTMTDSVNLFVVLTTVVMFWTVRHAKTPVLLSFYLPPLAVVCLVNALVAHRFLYEPPRALPGLPLSIHVGLAFCAYALFFVANMTSVGYIFEAQHLKRHETIGTWQRLPSLEKLDQTLWRLIYCGYPLFVVALLLGLIWSWADRDLLGPHWWLAPKVTLSWVMAIFYAVAFHARRSGWLRGPKLACLVVIGSSFLLLMYLVLAATNLRGYEFWGTTP